MKRVIIESPYAGKDEIEINRNIQFARACMRECLLKGESPYASHLLYTPPGVLDDNNQEERNLGIQAGLFWGQQADKTVVYTKYGITKDGNTIFINASNVDENYKPINSPIVFEL